MKRLFMHILLFVLGALMLTAVFIFEIDGTLGFLLATFGVFLIGVALTLKFIIHFFLNII